MFDLDDIKNKYVFVNYLNEMFKIVIGFIDFILKLFKNYWINICEIIGNVNTDEIDFEIETNNQTTNQISNQISNDSDIIIYDKVYDIKIFFNDEIINHAINDTTKIVKNIVQNYKIENGLNELNESNESNESNQIIKKVPLELTNNNYLNIVKEEINKSELPEIINNLNDKELDNLKNELLHSIINIANNLKLNNNQLFNKYLQILLNDEHTVENNTLEYNNVLDITDNTNSLDSLDISEISNENEDDDDEKDEDETNINFDIINKCNYMNDNIDKNVKVSNILKVIDEIKL